MTNPIPLPWSVIWLMTCAILRLSGGEDLRITNVYAWAPIVVVASHGGEEGGKVALEVHEVVKGGFAAGESTGPRVLVAIWEAGTWGAKPPSFQAQVKYGIFINREKGALVMFGQMVPLADPGDAEAFIAVMRVFAARTCDHAGFLRIWTKAGSRIRDIMCEFMTAGRTPRFPGFQIEGRDEAAIMKTIASDFRTLGVFKRRRMLDAVEARWSHHGVLHPDPIVSGLLDDDAPVRAAALQVARTVCPDDVGYDVQNPSPEAAERWRTRAMAVAAAKAKPPHEGEEAVRSALPPGLASSLMSKEPAVRRNALKTLRAVAGDDFGYDPENPSAESIQRWIAWGEQEQEKRRAKGR